MVPICCVVIIACYQWLWHWRGREKQILFDHLLCPTIGEWEWSSLVREMSWFTTDTCVSKTQIPIYLKTNFSHRTAKNIMNLGWSFQFQKCRCSRFGTYYEVRYGQSNYIFSIEQGLSINFAEQLIICKTKKCWEEMELERNLFRGWVQSLQLGSTKLSTLIIKVFCNDSYMWSETTKCTRGQVWF